MSAVLAALRRPVIAAPMAGGPSTPDLVAAVSGAGGLGMLAGGYTSAAALSGAIAATRARTDRPFGVNIFAPVPSGAGERAVADYARTLAGEARRLGVELGEPTGGDDGYPEKLGLLLDDPVPVVSFAFDLPDAATVEALHGVGSEVWATVTDPATAHEAAGLGVDALVVQGMEAGAHRGGRDDTDEYALLPLLRLVAARVPGPLVAAGGVADGASVAAVLAAGAAAAALGTAFLGCPEAGTSPTHLEALRVGTAPTALTRAFTGRRARGVRNAFMDAHDAAAPAAYPQVHQVTAPLRAAARAAGDASALHLWAGQAYPLLRRMPAADLVALLTAEAAEAAAALAARLGRLAGAAQQGARGAVHDGAGGTDAD